jgi:hypothetical protein
MKYVKRPIVVEAFQYGVDKTPEWFKKADKIEGRQERWPFNPTIIIKTRDGDMTAHKRDMIIKGIKGEIYPCKKDIFDASYDAIEENENVKS